MGAAVLLAAGLLRGFKGYGVAIVAVPLLSLVCPHLTAVTIVVVIQVIVSFDGLPGAVRDCDRMSVALLVAAAALATPVGVLAPASLSDVTFRLCITAIVAGASVVVGRGLTPGRLASGPGRGCSARWRVCSTDSRDTGTAHHRLLSRGRGRQDPGPRVDYYARHTDECDRAAAAGPRRSADARPTRRSGATYPLDWLGSWIGGQLYRRASDRTYRRTGIIVLGATALVTASRGSAALS